jgi:hypothetical protein
MWIVRKCELIAQKAHHNHFSWWLSAVVKGKSDSTKLLVGSDN